MHFYYRKETDLSLEKALSGEWLETNGLGGYASSTIVNCNTRKYHGLLVSKIEGLPGRYVLLNKIEDIVVNDGQENFLISHQYPNFFQAGGFNNLEEFKLTTHPIWSFKLADLVVTKEILMLHEENTVLFKYSVDGTSNCKIILRPLLSFRSFHNLQRENSLLVSDIENLADGFSCAPYKRLPQIFFQTNVAHNFISQPLWYRNFIYTKEQERGYDFYEDLFSPGVITFEFTTKREMFCVCSLTRQRSNFPLSWETEIKRRSNSVANIAVNEFRKQLHHTGKSFIVQGSIAKKSQSLVAGYHWFLEWGRDTMISLPGLTLYSGQEDVCLAILKNFALHEHQGLIPNYLGPTKETNVHNTIDASLWFGWAVQQYYLKTGNLKNVATYFWSTLKNIFKFYRDGTLYNIKMRDNGLLYAGNPELNLTWMDAMIDCKPITSRYGCAVEVNALWFNLLNFMLEIARGIKDPSEKELQSIVKLIKSSFTKVFWCEDKGYLYDFVNAAEKNSALRPNQIFAVSLPYSPLLIRMAVKTVAVVKEHLLTPYGLRTLAKHEEGYIGSYNGNPQDRDRAYHNGMVWPWLLGHFTEALLKVTSDRRKVLAIINPCLEALRMHLAEYGLGSIAEIFSGDSPHSADGCISQAWSVAEVLRLTYLLNINN
ncbi:MAG: amylo-alpha-1,6-glucosidase [Coxiellaceae bacterium]|jgi:predicted glycogen debranching enzyme|nr:amylo-alpha-1,6-glucosidase [Coxiellaceae bacterium]